jgi:hypothetical protein
MTSRLGGIGVSSGAMSRRGAGHPGLPFGMRAEKDCRRDYSVIAPVRFQRGRGGNSGLSESLRSRAFGHLWSCEATSARSIYAQVAIESDSSPFGIID